MLALSFSIGGEYDGTLSGDAIAFNEPSCLTALPDGELCVADTKNHRLVILTPEGQPRAFLTERPQTSRGKKSSQLQSRAASLVTIITFTSLKSVGLPLRKLRYLMSSKGRCINATRRKGWRDCPGERADRTEPVNLSSRHYSFGR